MKKKCTFITILLGILCPLLLLLTVSSFAQPLEKERISDTVNVTGYGENEREARTDAIKKAVEKVVGMYVVSETIVKNEKLIKDEVLSQSNGFIKDFVIRDKGKDKAGLFYLTADATVESTRLTRRLGELNIGIKDLGTEKYLASTESMFNVQKDFKSMFSAVMIEPMMTNKRSIYRSDIKEIKHLNYSELKGYPISWKGNDVKKAQIGEVRPILVKFRHALSTNYLSQVLGFLTANQIESYDKKDFLIKFVEPSFPNRAWVNYLDKQTYHFLPDQGAIISSLLNDYFSKYKLFTTIYLLRDDGTTIRQVTYMGIDLYDSDASALNTIHTDTGESNGVAYHNAPILITGFNYLREKHLEIMESVGTYFTVVILSKEELLSLKNIKKVSIWKKN